MPLPPERRPAVVLHIGTGKTGTTSIQAMLRHNRVRLLEHGVLFPASPGERRHTRLGLAVHPEDARRSTDWAHQPESSPVELRPVFERQLSEEIRSSSPTQLVLSDEALSGAPRGAIDNLRGFLAGIASDVRLVVYLRRQDDHLCSRYQQVVKFAGETRRLSERLDAVGAPAFYDYRSRLGLWQQLLVPDRLVVRRFEREAFAGGSLQQDFLEAAGLGVRLDQLEPVPTRNESLDAESVELLRLLNLLRRERGGEPEDVPPRPRLVRRLARASQGPVLTLPEDRLDAFMSLWEESNRAVAHDLVPDAPPSLFSTSRRTRHTTTAQRLDPDRIRHFVEVLELPAELLAPLQRIAAREGGG